LQNYVVDLPSSEIERISFLLRFVPLQRQARQRLRKISRVEVERSIFFDFHSELGDWMISQYLQSKSFDDANYWAQHILQYTSDFNGEQVRSLVVGAAGNSQVTGSFQLPVLVNNLRSKNVIPEGEFDRLIEENNLTIHLI
jgi:hypothetical protein